MSDKSKYYADQKRIKERFAREWAQRKPREPLKCFCGEPAKWQTGNEFFCQRHEIEAGVLDV